MRLHVAHVSSAPIASTVGFAGTPARIVAAAGVSFAGIGAAFWDVSRISDSRLRGVSFAGIGAAFRSLAAGFAVHALEQAPRKLRRPIS